MAESFIMTKKFLARVYLGGRLTGKLTPEGEKEVVLLILQEIPENYGRDWKGIARAVEETYRFIRIDVLGRYLQELVDEGKVKMRIGTERVEPVPGIFGYKKIVINFWPTEN